MSYHKSGIGKSRLFLSWAPKLFLQRIDHPATGRLVERADLLRDEVYQLDGGGVGPAGVNRRFRVRSRGKRLQLFSVVPDQPEPGTDLVDKGG